MGMGRRISSTQISITKIPIYVSKVVVPGVVGCKGNFLTIGCNCLIMYGNHYEVINTVRALIKLTGRQVACQQGDYKCKKCLILCELHFIDIKKKIMWTWLTKETLFNV